MTYHIPYYFHSTYSVSKSVPKSDTPAVCPLPRLTYFLVQSTLLDITCYSLHYLMLLGTVYMTCLLLYHNLYYLHITYYGLHYLHMYFTSVDFTTLPLSLSTLLTYLSRHYFSTSTLLQSTLLLPYFSLSLHFYLPCGRLSRRKRMLVVSQLYIGTV